MKRAGMGARAVLVLAAFGILVAGCGRKSDLLTPTQAAREAQREAAGRNAPEQPPAAPAEDRPFILDGLI